MRAKEIVLSALVLGLAAGYVWSAMPPANAGPVSANANPAPTQEQVERAVYYPNCATARAAGHAPILAGQPGYREELDADGDGIACEPYLN